MKIQIANIIIDSKHVQVLPIIENQINVEIISLSKSKARWPKPSVNKQEINKLAIAIANASLIISFVLFIILKTGCGIFIILFIMSDIKG
ncbi:MAG TPA: hypothetical protein PLP23_20985 [Panacibacter sp.]|nr:hypothetical protein [Panacibacter sp.]